MPRLLPLLLLGCIQPLTDPGDSVPADTAPQGEVLLDTEALLPGPDGESDYVDFHFDFSGEPTWIHLDLTSAEAATLSGVLFSPTEGCALEVPYWTAYMEDQEGAHRNQGWVRLVEPGRHTLSVFGAAPGQGALVRCQVETVPVELDLPFQDATMDCTLADEACICTQVCGCRTIDTR